ncbi:MAG: lipid-A-disaccharide synthase [Desulfurivibrionaceae bacterium]|nr:lipid-A-disaccharide synthase [Desulfurivibrionaceae bacterium]
MAALNNRDVMIVAGEASGDMHGARVLQALQKHLPQLRSYGMGGDALRQAGMEILVDAADMAVVGIMEVLAHLGAIVAAQNTLHCALKERRPRLLILIDYPDFNLMLAKKARRLHIPVLYYISPQVWAWRSGRVKKIRGLVDQMAVILPFEKEFYARHGFEVTYVGHPLADSVKPTLGKEAFLARHGIKAAKNIIGIMPGSRRKEIATMLPVFLKAARIVQKRYPETTFLVPLAPTLSGDVLAENGLSDYSLDIHVVKGDRYDLMASCDLVMAASGTVTLELALLQIPMLVSYKLSAMTYFLGRRFIKVDFASLVNLVADEEVVPELLQDEATPEEIARTLQKLWPGSEAHAEMTAKLAEVKDALGQGGASDQVAKLALKFYAPPKG